MIPEFNKNGRLPPGIHQATWDEFTSRFGFTERRKDLLEKLDKAIGLLRKAGCHAVYPDGSFVTSKPQPDDIDVCWATDGVDLDTLDPIFKDFSNFRANQKTMFGYEFFAADLPNGRSGKTFLEFFQIDKETQQPKGIVVIDLRRMRA